MTSVREIFDTRVREFAEAKALLLAHTHELEQARAARDEAQREVDDAKAEHLAKPAVGTTRRVAAESARRVAEMSLEASEAQRDQAQEAVRRARHVRDSAEFGVNEERRSAIRTGLAAHVKRIVELACEVTSVVDAIAASVNEHQDLEDRAEQLTTSLGRYDLVPQLELSTVRVACGIAVERELGETELPEGDLGDVHELSRAIARLRDAAHKLRAEEFAVEFERVTAVVAAMLGGDVPDWVRPAPEPGWDDQSVYARCHASASALLDEIGMLASDTKDHTDERLSDAGHQSLPTAVTDESPVAAASSAFSQEAP
ncbi:MAG TPA: hypothetical protein VK843_17015 [Planctomycetota bacterium]|nr:hypothetical protein [Planctomycetota bacterium]